jgi:hypothetical protein
VQRALSATKVLGRGSIRVEALEGLDRRVGALWDRLAGESAIVPVRDAEFYAWRFGTTPSRAQRAFMLMDGRRPIGLCAIERRWPFAAIVDLFTSEDAFVVCARAAASAAGAQALSLQLNQRGLGAEELWRAGFFPREAKAFQVLAIPGGSPPSGLFDPAAWYTTWGDGDVDEVLSRGLPDLGLPGGAADGGLGSTHDLGPRGISGR